MAGPFRIPPGFRIPQFPVTDTKTPPPSPGRKVDPSSPSSNNPNHPGRPSGGNGGGGNSGGNSGGGGGNSGGGNSGGGNTFEPNRDSGYQPWMPPPPPPTHKRIEVTVPALQLTLLSATVTSYATYYKVINALVATIGRSLWSAAFSAAARLGAFVGTRAVAGAWLGPWGVGAVTVASIVVFFVMSEGSADAAQESPVDKYRREVEKLWRRYQSSSDPSVQLETLRKLFLLVFGMQICLDAAIQEQLIVGAKVCAENPSKKPALVAQFVNVVDQYLTATRQSSAALQQILSEAGRLLLAIQTHYGWNQAYMANRHALYQNYFNHFHRTRFEWEERIAKIKADAPSVEAALTRS